MGEKRILWEWDWFWKVHQLKLVFLKMYFQNVILKMHFSKYISQKKKNSVGMEIGFEKCTSTASNWNLSEMRRNQKSNFDKQLLQDNILS